ncbi:MAG: transcriptional repressor NrdR [Myxococcales bacterium]|nr:transcriptional repressor NrdR [Myxococcales bacterium]
MKCPGCGALEHKVIDSRPTGANDAIRRRRECESCGRRFTTYERLEEAMPLIVKKDGRREAYDRHKLLLGLERACQKRPVSAAARDEVANAVERELEATGDKEIPSSAIGEIVMNHLRDLDQVAYVRFASVYRQFDDIGEFLDELQRLTHRAHARPSTPGQKVPRE